jgi:restriction system protein
MTFLEAAEQVLAEAGEALHFREIARRAIEAGLIVSDGATPEVSMGSMLYVRTSTEGSSPFVRKGRGVFDLAKRSAGGIDDEVEAINSSTRSKLAELLLQMPAQSFEELVRSLLVKMGFDEQSVVVTRFSGDGGIDVKGRFTASGLTSIDTAVQAKRWRANVQAGVVRELRGSLQVGQQGTIITTSGFSSGAREEAKAQGKTPIGLIDGKTLVDLLIRHQVGVAERSLVVTLIDDEYWAEFMPQQPVVEPAPVVAPKPSHPVAPPAARQYTLFGATHEFTTWKALLLAVTTELLQRYPDIFVDRATSLRGRTRQYVSDDPSHMIAPMQLSDSSWWLETNQSRKSAMELAYRLLAAFGEPPEVLVLDEAPEPDESRPSETA